MNRSILVAPTVLAIALLVAAGVAPATAQCFESPESEEAADGAPAPLPEGAFLSVRDQRAAFYIVGSGVVVLHGYTNPAEYCSTRDWRLIEMWNLREITLPQDQDLVMWLFQAEDAATWVYPLIPVPEGKGLCYIIQNTEPIASGSARIVVTDDNIALGEDRAWAAGVRAHGLLEDASGETVVVNDTWHCAFNTGPPACGFCRSQVNMKWVGGNGND